MFAIILLFAVRAAACGELCQTDALEQYARLNVLAMKTRYEIEQAAFLQRKEPRINSLAPVGVGGDGRRGPALH